MILVSVSNLFIQRNPYAGLSGMDLLFADTEAVKSYANYPLNVLGAFAIPLPETYDSKTIDYYFKCRPHILAARIFEVGVVSHFHHFDSGQICLEL